MSYISPALRERVDALSPELKSEINRRDVQINTLQDLIAVIERIIADSE